MLLREKGKPESEPVSMGWDEAQAALLAGTHEAAEGAAREPSGPVPVEPGLPDFDAMTKAELEAYAAEKGIGLGEAKTKAEILDAVKAAG